MLCLSGPAALAQAKYPSRPVRIIVPLPPGGAIDVFVRGLGKEFETRTGASVVVENRAGANTIIAANACKSAAPDGYTFCLLTRSTVSINPEIYRKLSYDPLKDFEAVTNGFFGQQIVILNKNVPVKTLAELVDYSRRTPTSSTSHRWGWAATRISSWNGSSTRPARKITHVPYKGFPEAMTSFKANDVQMIALLVGNPDLARQIREGEVKGLLLPGSKRSNLVPDVPTFAELGLSGDQTKFTPWFGFFAPKGTPKEYVEAHERGNQRDHGERRIPREIPDLEGSGVGRLEARRLCQVPGVRPQGRRRSRRDLRRQARRIKRAWL